MTLDLYNNEAEALILAGILRNPEAFWTVNSVGLSADDFLGVENRRVWKAVAAVAEERKAPDLPLVIEELRLAGSDTSLEYLTRLTTLPCSVPQAAEFARTVKGLATSRRLATVGARIIELAKEKRADSEAAVAEAETELRRVRDTLPAPERSPDPADILRRLRSAGPTKSIPIRFVPSLHWLTGGFIPGHFWVIGGFSSTGKSAVACNVIADVVQNRGKWVGLVSTEMTQENYAQRMLALMSGVPFRQIRDRAVIGMEQVEALRDAEKRLMGANLRIYDTVYRISDIRLHAQQMKETTGLDLLIVDFLQNVHGSSHDEVADAREVAIELQLMAKELDMTVIALSQLSNEMAKAQASGENNGYYSFKGHGAIRDASDFSILLKRDRVRQSSNLDFEVVKNRHGEMQVIPTHIDLPTGRITEVGEEEEE